MARSLQTRRKGTGGRAPSAGIHAEQARLVDRRNASAAAVCGSAHPSAGDGADEFRTLWQQLEALHHAKEAILAEKYQPAVRHQLALQTLAQRGDQVAQQIWQLQAQEEAKQQIASPRSIAATPASAAVPDAHVSASAAAAADIARGSYTSDEDESAADSPPPAASAAQAAASSPSSSSSSSSLARQIDASANSLMALATKARQQQTELKQLRAQVTSLQSALNAATASAEQRIVTVKREKFDAQVDAHAAAHRAASAKRKADASAEELEVSAKRQRTIAQQLDSMRAEKAQLEERLKQLTEQQSELVRSQTCTDCLEPLLDQPRAVLPCGHVYGCVDCGERWLKHQQSLGAEAATGCPVCRRQLANLTEVPSLQTVLYT